MCAHDRPPSSFLLPRPRRSASIRLDRQRSSGPHPHVGCGSPPKPSCPMTVSTSVDVIILSVICLQLLNLGPTAAVQSVNRQYLPSRPGLGRRLATTRKSLKYQRFHGVGHDLVEAEHVLERNGPPRPRRHGMSRGHACQRAPRLMARANSTNSRISSNPSRVRRVGVRIGIGDPVADDLRGGLPVNFT